MKNETPLHYAAKEHLDAITEILILQGADINSKNHEYQQIILFIFKILIYNKSTGKLRSSIHSSNSNSKTLTKDPLSKSMKNIRKNTNQTPLYESKNNSIKANKYHTSSCRIMKNIFSLLAAVLLVLL